MSVVRAVMEVLDIGGESVSQISTELVVQRKRSLAMSTLPVVCTSKAIALCCNHLADCLSLIYWLTHATYTDYKAR